MMLLYSPNKIHKLNNNSRYAEAFSKAEEKHARAGEETGRGDDKNRGSGGSKSAKVSKRQEAELRDADANVEKLKKVDI